MSNLSAVLWQVTFWWDNDDNVGFVLDQHAELDFYRACSLKEQSADIHVAPLGTWTHYSDSESTYLCS